MTRFSHFLCAIYMYIYMTVTCKMHTPFLSLSLSFSPLCLTRRWQRYWVIRVSTPSFTFLYSRPQTVCWWTWRGNIVPMTSEEWWTSSKRGEAACWLIVCSQVCYMSDSNVWCDSMLFLRILSVVTLSITKTRFWVMVRTDECIMFTFAWAHKFSKLSIVWIWSCVRCAVF